jgi:large subunit ribosomal protein L2
MKLSKIKPIKKHIFGFKKYAGRNNLGRITVRHQGAGHKKLYRFIDFKRNNTSESIITNIEYDPNRSSFIAKIYSKETASYNYILCSQEMEVLQEIKNYNEKESSNILTPKNGDCLPLEKFTVGDLIHNIEDKPNQGGIFARSAGTYGQLVQKLTAKENYCIVKLPSGEQRYISLKSKATLGKVSNENYQNIIIGKAGRSRWMNKRPTVRGVAMNAVDHPHGGGRGKTAGGGPTKTPWGWPAKGVPTRKKKSNHLIALKKNKNK